MPITKLDCGLEPRKATPSETVWRTTGIAVLILLVPLVVIIVEYGQAEQKAHAPNIKPLKIEAHASPLKTG